MKEQTSIGNVMYVISTTVILNVIFPEASMYKSVQALQAALAASESLAFHNHVAVE